MHHIYFLFSNMLLFWAPLVAGCFTESVLPDHPSCRGPACGWGGDANYMNSMGKECIFPFIYKGVTYDSCTSEDHFRPWCPTNLNQQHEVVVGTGHWGTCGATCFNHNQRVSFDCSDVPTCCKEGFGAGDLYQPNGNAQTTHIIGVHSQEARDMVMQDVFSLDDKNILNPNIQKFSSLTTMFLADLSPVEVGFLLNDTRVDFVECNGIVSTRTTDAITVQGEAPTPSPRRSLRGESARDPR